MEATSTKNAQPGFWWSLGLAMIALGLAVSIATLLFLQLSPQQGQGSSQLQVRKFPGAELIPRIGQAEATPGGALRITRLQGGQNPRALVTQSANLNTADFPFLQISITGLHPGLKASFIWRSVAEPQKLQSINLDTEANGNASYQLNQYPGWQGSITDIGIDVYGELGESGLEIEGLALHPASANRTPGSIVTQWQAFQPWDMVSINHQTTKALPPTLVAALVAGLAMAMLLLLKLWQPKLTLRTSMLMVLVLSWIALDVIWQQKFHARVEATREQFEGKTRKEQHLAESDRELYLFTQRLKEQHLGEPGPRIFLLNRETRDHHYVRLRAQFHLLPHNIYNFGDLPLQNQLRPGDYLLVVGQLPALQYSPDEAELRWDNDQVLPVQQLHTERLGQLYRVAEPGADVPR